jgi:ferredoxin
MIALNPESRAKGRPESSCVKCGVCFSSCPKGAISFESRIKLRGAATKRPARWGQGFLEVFLDSLLSPALLFPFTALSFGMIISSGFSAETMSRLVRLVTTGSFLLGAGR